MNDQTTRVANRHIKAVLETFESGSHYVIKGKYPEMQPLLARLKALGFRFDGVNQSWSIALVALTPDKRKKLDKLLGRDTPTPGRDVAKVEEIRKRDVARVEEMRDVFQQITKLDLPGFALRTDATMTPAGYVVSGLSLTGATYPLREEAKRAGGVWASEARAYIFKPQDTDPKKFEQFLDILTAASRAYAENWTRIQAVIGVKRHWPYLSIALDADGVIRGKTRPYADRIREHFESARWTGYEWKISFSEPSKKFETFISEMDAEEEKKRVEEKQTSMEIPVGSPTARTIRQVGDSRMDRYPIDHVFRDIKSGDILRVTRVQSEQFEDGLSFGLGQDEGWVHHLTVVPATEEQAQVVINKEIKAQGRTKATRRVAEIVREMEKRGDRPGGSGSASLRLNGDVILTQGRSTMLVGGGTWFVLETGRAIWFVRNNGADGDNWSANNIQTGGAGAIGWRVPWDDGLAAELLALDAVLK